jgi:hypothetical protein
VNGCSGRKGHAKDIEILAKLEMSPRSSGTKTYSKRAFLGNPRVVLFDFPFSYVLLAKEPCFVVLLFSMLRSTESQHSDVRSQFRPGLFFDFLVDGRVKFCRSLLGGLFMVFDRSAVQLDGGSS